MPNVDSAILQRAKGADVFVVGGWRYVTRPKIVSAKNITRVEQLKGRRIGLRELGGLTDRLLFVAMLRTGIDVIDEMRLVGQLTVPLEPDDILRSEAMERGFAELCERPGLQPIIKTVRAALPVA